MINNKFNANQLSKIYAEELGAKGIYTDVELAFSGANVATSSFQTKKVNASLLQYGKQNVVYGILENPNQYYLKEMKWILVSSVLSICIVTMCFYYTAKTLLSQQKLALLKNQFVSNMTHEIHTPLASIKITAEALQKYDLDKNSISEYLEIIQNQTDKLIDLTNQLLNKARNEHFELQDFEDLALNHLIRNVINHQAVEDKVKINYNESNFRIKGNNVHLTNVFNNIVDNALKYNRSEIKQVDIDAIKRNHIIEISISDNGIGISAENLKHIFDPFYRVTANETHDVKGYGLGLDYAKTVIEKHGGTIEVRSEINKGSTFIINLPYEG
jgi:signal transduction histidine kinase